MGPIQITPPPYFAQTILIFLNGYPFVALFRTFKLGYLWVSERQRAALISTYRCNSLGKTVLLLFDGLVFY